VLKLFATAPKGIEPILAQELAQLGAAATPEALYAGARPCGLR